MGDKHPSLQPNATILAAVPELLSKLLKPVRKAERHAAAGDPELGIHDMRVALKRLREALRLFKGAFRRKALRPHWQRIETLNSLLGEVRDRDITLARLGTYGGIARPVVAQLRAEREEAQQRLEQELKAWGQKRHFAEIGRFVRKPTSYRAACRGELAAQLAIAGFEARLGELEKAWHLARFFPTQANLHRARIKNKKVRYALEPLLPLLPAEGKEFADQLGALHDALGEIHDDDVLADRIEKVGRELANTAALGSLWSDVARIRRQHMVELRQAATRFEMLGGWQGLRAAVKGERSKASQAERSGHVEHEQKLLLKGRPPLPLSTETQFILQGYLATGTSEERVRMQVTDSGPAYSRTRKEGLGAKRQEYEEAIDAATFFDLWTQTDGHKLEKLRHVVVENGQRWEIDRYLDRDLWVAEAEFPEGAATRVALPEWLAPWVERDVSEDPRFRNQNLAH